MRGPLGCRLRSRPVPERYGLDRRPNQWLKDGEQWPDGELDPDAPHIAFLVRDISRRLRRALEDEGWNLEEAARECFVSQHAIWDLLKGNGWGTLPTIGRIEARLNRQLWTDIHRKRARYEEEPDQARRSRRPIRYEG